MFAEIERDLYENKETSARAEEPEDDWDELFDEEDLIETDRIGDIIGIQFFPNKGIKKQSDKQLDKSIGSWEKNIEEAGKELDERRNNNEH